MDAVSSWWTTTHGHSHPFIAEAVYEQFKALEHVIFAGFTHPKAVELAERITRKLSYLDKVFFSDNGSTAVEIAIKMAFQYWYNKGKKKTKMIAFKNAYHGDTFGAMSVGGRSDFNKAFFPFLFDVIFIDVPTPGNEEKVKQQFEEAIKDDDVAAFIFEPLVQGAAGMVMYSADILDELVGLCKAKNIFVIADEVMTGFGRTGKLFATDYIVNKPDIVTLSKGLTGGVMALGLTVCSNKIYDAFLSDDHSKTFFHGHSFTANPLACAASCASLELFDRKGTWENIKMIEEEHQGFVGRVNSYNSLKDIRQTGTILALEFNSNESTSYFNSIRDELYAYFLEKNILLRPLGNVLYILPPYCIKKEELNLIYNNIEDFLKERFN